jgi:hypothetical protein
VGKSELEALYISLPPNKLVDKSGEQNCGATVERLQLEAYEDLG